MGVWLYALGIEIYWLLIRVASIWDKKAQKLYSGQNATALFISRNKRKAGKLYWFHCSSVGEFEQARPLIEELKKAHPHFLIAITFFSPSGYELRKDYPLAQYVLYLPKDSAANAKAFVEWLCPDKVFFVKYDFWYFFINQIKKQNISLYCLNAIFRKEQFFFSPFGGFYRQMLQRFDHFFVQTQDSVGLLASIGIKNSTLTNDTRFDRVEQVAKMRLEMPRVDEFCGNEFCIVLGSVWPQDMKLWYELKLDIACKLIVVPHEIEEGFLLEIEQNLPMKTIRYSMSKTESISNYDALLVDNVGLLSSLYFYGKMAYVGGAFYQGLHNILEAATFGQPIAFGNKNYQKFNEAVEMVEMGISFAVSDSKELKKVIERFYHNPSQREQISKLSREYVLCHCGGTQLILQSIEANL